MKTRTGSTVSGTPVMRYPAGMQASSRNSSRALLWIIGIFGLLSLWVLAALGKFMFDAGATEHAFAPSSRDFLDDDLEKPFFPKHSCFTSYVVAQQLALQGESNIYEAKFYRDPERPTVIHSEIGDLLQIDRYQYPPPFLLLPWVLTKLGSGFFGARALFYVLTLGAFALCLFCAQRWLQKSSPHAPLVWLAWPLVLLASTTRSTLQIGNVHAFVMIISVLGMLAVYADRPRLGGALLGFVTVGKIFPGLLLVYLLGRGQRKAVLSAAAFGLLFALLTLGLFGQAPYRAFFEYQLPRLASGEAFDFAFRMPRAMLVNSSFTGIAYRLQGLGLLEDASGLARVLSWGGGILLIAGAWIFGRARRPTLDRPGQPKGFLEFALWLALLSLAQMRSPFLPWGYGSFVILWLLSVLLVAPHAKGGLNKKHLGLLPVWFILSASIPLPFGGPTLRTDFAFAFAGTAIALALATWALARARPDNS